jgi:hypothetical protein
MESIDGPSDVSYRLFVKDFIEDIECVIPPFLTSVKTRELLGYSSCRGGTPPIGERGRILL